MASATSLNNLHYRGLQKSFNDPKLNSREQIFEFFLGDNTQLMELNVVRVRIFHNQNRKLPKKRFRIPQKIKQIRQAINIIFPQKSLVS